MHLRHVKIHGWVSCNTADTGWARGHSVCARPGYHSCQMGQVEKWKSRLQDEPAIPRMIGLASVSISVPPWGLLFCRLIGIWRCWACPLWVTALPKNYLFQLQWTSEVVVVILSFVGLHVNEHMFEMYTLHISGGFSKMKKGGRVAWYSGSCGLFTIQQF